MSCFSPCCVGISSFEISSLVTSLGSCMRKMSKETLVSSVVRARGRMRMVNVMWTTVSIVTNDDRWDTIHIIIVLLSMQLGNKYFDYTYIMHNP